MFEEVDQIFSHYCDKHVSRQLGIMSGISNVSGVPVENFKQQLDAVLYYLKVKRQQKTSKILVILKEQLNLTGKFGVFDKPLVRIN